MTDKQNDWINTRNKLIDEIKNLGFPYELGVEIAKQLQSPKAMQRMLGYLYSVKPDSAELIVDEMLAICSDIDSWRKKKESEDANRSYTEWLNYGPDDPDDYPF